LPALFATSCSTPGETGAPTSASTSAATNSKGATAPAGASNAPRPLGVREGSTVALSIEGDLAVVADEDHTALDLVALPVVENEKAE
jgi:hypothetical protein